MVASNMFTQISYHEEEDIRRLKTSDISSTHIYINYYNVKNIVVDARNSYVNASRLCHGYGKELRTWLNIPQSKAFMAEVYSQLSTARMTSNTTDSYWLPSLIESGGDIPEIRGTYVHPTILPQILCWLDPSFAIGSSIVNNVCAIENPHIMKQKYEEHIARLTEEVKSANQKYEDLSELHNTTLWQLEQFLGHS